MARRALAPGTTGRVLAVFRTSFYVETGDGALACVGPRAMGAGPLNVLADLPRGLDWQAAGPGVDAPVRVARESLTVDDRYGFGLTEATDWRPAPLGVWRPADLANGLARLAESAAPPAEGLSPWVPALAAGAALETRNDPLLRAAQPAVAALAGWLEAALAGTNAPVPDPVAGLIGLGPGLTPSGDDLLGGVLIALSALGHGAIAEILAAWLLPRAQDGTGRISRAHLATAADGQGAEAIHDALAALARADAPTISAALGAVDAIGHSSGWDALAGVVLAARVVAKTP